MLVLVLVVAAGFWWLTGSRGLSPFTKPVAADGRTITVTYTGSECQDGSRLEVDEQDDRVVLTVHRWSRATSCTDIGIPYTLTAVLSRPLGDREVVDGACDVSPYRDWSDCATP